MSTTKTFAGQSFNLPLNREPKSSNWGTQLSNFNIAVADYAIPKTGGTYALSAELNLGATYGLLAPYFKSAAANIAQAGVLRLARADTVSWRNEANAADLALSVDSSGALQFNSISLVDLSTVQTLLNKTLTSPKLNEAVAVTTTATKLNYLTAAAGTTGTTSTNLVFSTSPVLVTPVLGAATATSVNKLTLTAPATGATLTLADGSTLATSGAFSQTLTATGATNVTLPLTGTLATLAGNEVLTNKTLSGNTATSLISGSGTLTLNTSGTITVPNVTDTLVGKATTDILTNKTLTSATVSNLINLAESAAPSTPASGNVSLYAKADKKLYTKDSAGTEQQVGSGGGSKNYVSLPSTYTAAASSSVVGWYFSGSGTISTITSSIPRLTTTGTAIQFVSNISGDYIRYRFALDDADISKKVLFSFAQIVAAAGEFKIEAYSGTVSSCTTQLTLSTDASSVSALPALTGVFETTFDCTTATHYEIRFVATGASKTLKISDVLVSPDKRSVSSAVVGAPQDVTVTGSWSANTTYTAKETRIGSMARYSIKVAVSGVPTSATLTVNLPSGRTIDTTALTNVVASYALLGECAIYDTSAGSTMQGRVTYDTTTSVKPERMTLANTNQQDLTGITQAAPMTFATGDWVSLDFTVPIAEWAFSGTVNLAQNDVEYASTAGTWDADSTTAAYGPSGTTMGGSLGSSRDKTVTWATPIQSTDEIRLQLAYVASPYAWFDAAQNAPLSLSSAGTFATSAGAFILSSTATTTVVRFCRYKQIANDDLPVTDWASDMMWRLVKVKAGQAVGFGEVAQSSNGLVKSAGQLKGTNTNDSAATGYVGEIVRGDASIASTTIADSTETDITSASLSLTSGHWQICYGIPAFFTVTAAGYLNSQMMVTDASNNRVAFSITQLQSYSGASGQNFQHWHACAADLKVSATTTYKLRGNRRVGGTVSSVSFANAEGSAAYTGADCSPYFYAIRVR